MLFDFIHHIRIFSVCILLLLFASTSVIASENRSSEAIIESQIMAYKFQTETGITDRHYKSGQRYMDARSIIRSLMQNVSRNGTILLNITQDRLL